MDYSIIIPNNYENDPLFKEFEKCEGPVVLEMPNIEAINGNKVIDFIIRIEGRMINGSRLKNDNENLSNSRIIIGIDKIPAVYNNFINIKHGEEG